MKDERNHHGAVDKSFSEQQICILHVDANYNLDEKIEPIHVVELGFTAGRKVADKWQMKYR